MAENTACATAALPETRGGRFAAAWRNGVAMAGRDVHGQVVHPEATGQPVLPERGGGGQQFARRAPQHTGERRQLALFG